MKRISKKTSLMIMMIACLFAVVSVGFAAWILIGEDTESQTGAITVDTVDDQRHVITLNADNDYDLCFISDAKADGWLQYEKPAGLTKDFDASIGFTVSNPETAKVTLTLTLGAELASAIEKGYLKVTITYDDTAQTLTSGSVSIEETLSESNTGGELVITFAWGEKFGGLDPVNYYNDGTKTVTEYGDEALAALKIIEALNGKTAFNLEIETSNINA